MYSQQCTLSIGNHRMNPWQYFSCFFWIYFLRYMTPDMIFYFRITCIVIRFYTEFKFTVHKFVEFHHWSLITQLTAFCLFRYGEWRKRHITEAAQK